VGQITLSKPEIAPPDDLTIRFFVTGQRTLEVKLTFNGETVRSLGQLANVSGLQTVSWDGVTGGEGSLPDGSYQIEVHEGANKLSQAALRINTANPQRPLLLLPEQKGQLSRGKVRFVWEGSKDASSYQLKIWQGQTQYAAETYVTSYESETPLQAGTWQWQVEAVTAAGRSALSEVGSFVIASNLPTVLEVTNVQGGPNPFAPNGNGRFEQFHLAYSLTQNAMVSIVIYNLAGGEVYRREALPEGVGDHAFAWDGRDRRGRIVPPGAYVLLIAAKNEQNRAPGGARKLISVIY
jgi:flagellar hook assembly protein FlgD